MLIPIRSIKVPSLQPESMLMDSIKCHGVLHQVRLRRDGDSYEIVDGVQRVVAAKALGMPNIKAYLEMVSRLHVVDQTNIEFYPRLIPEGISLLTDCSFYLGQLRVQIVGEESEGPQIIEKDLNVTITGFKCVKCGHPIVFTSANSKAVNLKCSCSNGVMWII